MTLGCNLNCKYCYEGLHSKDNQKMLSVSDFKKAFDTYVYERCVLGSIENQVKWHFHGGEPLLYDKKDLVECIKYIKRRRKCFPNVYYCIQSNGLLLDDVLASFFAKEGVTIGISFDGFKTDERMVESANDALIEKLRKFKSNYGTNFGCLSVLTKNNIRDWFSDMQRTQDVFSDCGINILCPAKGKENDVPTADEQWEYWLKPCLESFLTEHPVMERYVRICIERFLTYDILKTVKDSSYKTGCFDRICGHGVNMISVKPDLTVYNCDKYMETGDHIEERPVYSINQRDFLGLQQTKRYIHYCDDLFKLENEHHCDLCPYSYLCLGGCQSYNKSMTGEVAFDFDMCNVYEKIYNFLRMHWMQIFEKHTFQTLFQIEDINPIYLQEMSLFGYRPVIDLDKNLFHIEKER